jgi:aminopeptidase N
MQFLRSLIVVWLVVMAGHATAVWPPPEKVADPGRRPGRIPAADDRGYDVLHLDLALDLLALPPSPGEIAGEATLRLRLLDPPPAILRLDLVDELIASDVRRDGQPVAFTQQGDSFTVALAAPTAGDVHEITIRYAGRPPRHGLFAAGLLMRQHGDGEPTVGNVSQPYSSHSWFPCKDHPSDKSTLALTVTAPDTLTVVATGRLLGTSSPTPGRTTWRWASDHPVAPYLVGVAVSNYTSWQEDCDGVPLEFHVFPEYETELAPVLAPTCAMLRWLTDLVGPYPFTGEKYAQAQISWLGAMENQTVSAMGTTSLVNDGAELTVVHELAHHWFGNDITPARWRDVWLNEGFARYVECLWLEHTEGEAAYREYLAALRRDDLFVGDGLLGDPEPVINLLIYNKGAWVLHMLRGYLGDDLFFAALAEYTRHPDLVGGHVDRASFAAAWSQATGRDIAAYLAPWLDTEAVPELAGRWRDLGGGRRLVEVLQQQPGVVFHLAVPVAVHTADGIQRISVLLDGPLGRREITTTAPIDSVVVDPDLTLLRRTSTTPAPRVLAVQPRPNPARNQVDLAFWLAADDLVDGRVYDVRGRLVRQVVLGLQRATTDEPRVWTWDGRDDGGRRVAAGVYWLELRTPTDRTVRKVTLVR